MIRLVAALALISITATGADATPSKSRASPDLTSDSINSAGPTRNDAALITKAEVLLDRNHFSPGQIDSKNGENFRKALAAFQQTQKLNPTGKIDPDTWNAHAPEPSAPVLKSYTISEEDVAGPFERQIPRSLEQMAKLHGLTYKSPLEELSEKRYAPIQKRGSFSGSTRPPLVVKRNRHLLGLSRCGASPGIRIITTIQSSGGKM